MASVFAAADGTATHDLQVGVASTKITPPLGLFLAGHELNRKATGVHDDLFAKAIVFYDGRTAVALLVCDLISIQYDTACEIRVAAAKRVANIPLPADHIVVQATHTHCGPDTIGIYGPGETTTGRNLEYMAELVNACADVIARAAARLQPAALLVAEAKTPAWVDNDSEKGRVEPTFGILQVVGADKKPVATLVNLACHPAVLDTDTLQYSADWCGDYYADMAPAIPGEHIFLQGAIGCWIQPSTPERTFALTAKYGRDLADSVVAALKTAKPLESARIRCASKPFEIEVQNPKFILMAQLGLTSRQFSERITTEVTWFSIGPAQFATHPGETAPVYSEQTRALMTTGPKFVLGLGQDHLGYICPPAYFAPECKARFADYLTSMSPGPNAGAAIMAALKALIP